MNAPIRIDIQPATPQLPLADAQQETRRVVDICNACRYCEGFCAVFPAIERRLDFSSGDLQHLANLCHNCGACLYACQYASPHPFEVNVPRSLARLRGHSYEHFAWPAAWAGLLRRQAPWTFAALSLGLGVFLLLGTLHGGWPAAGSADFYAVVPHDWLAALFGVLALWILLSMGMGLRAYWRFIGGRIPAGQGAPAAASAAADALSLRYLDGGGGGCHDTDDEPSGARRLLHHLLAYGFAMCFAATCVATFEAYGLGRAAPYAWNSLPVGLGFSGGVMQLAGAGGLLRLRLLRNPQQGDPAQRPMDLCFLALLLATSASGLILLGARSTPAMAPLLCLHLGIVAALFLSLPYGKFVHAGYRVLSLFRDALERRRAPGPALGGD
ncbi:tricarballylate utilization 4Fe-4S protein TcuB [Thiomonas sp. FB-6]|uniref:tricarballylate utilization 4Fe-4S protein TcuB n=1 Tax=Thiomonas sp. FB-6 TaxID=1158291 RepID=UPI00037A4B3B|nr:tricarballylate utilization 4Fe-4S protein TcuB [Thiomonas sp. FB-6]